MAGRILIDLAGGFVEPLDTCPFVIERAGPSGAPWPPELRDQLAAPPEQVVNLYELGRVRGAEVIVEALGTQTVIEGGGPLLRLAASAATIDRLATLFGGELDLLAPGTVTAVSWSAGLVIGGIGDRSEGRELVGAAVTDLALQAAGAIADRVGAVAVVGHGAWLGTCAGLLAGLREDPVLVIDCATGAAVSAAPLGQRRSIRARLGDWERLRDRLPG